MKWLRIFYMKSDRNMNNYFVYILKCSDNSFYTGITNDMEKRLINHNKGIASKYTRSRLPVSLIYKHPCKDKSAALKYEIAIKKLPRTKKEKLIKGLLSFEDIKIEKWLSSAISLISVFIWWCNSNNEGKY